MVQRKPITIKTKTQNKKTIIKTANPGERRQSDFHSYHIIRFKYPVFNEKSQGIQQNSKVRLDERKNKKQSIETVLEKHLMADLLDKGFFFLKVLNKYNFERLL